MTRSVLTGPPPCRGLAWAFAVLAGAAALVVVPPAPDVAAKDEPAKAALPADLALVPKEAFGFLTIRVADLWKDEGTKGLRAMLTKQDPEFYKQISVGVPPEQVERLTFVMPRVPKQEDQGALFVMIVATTKPYDKKKLLDEMLPESREEKHKGTAYHVAGEAAVYPVDKTTFVMGPTAGVEMLMDAAGKNAGGPMAPALAAAAGKHHLAGGLRPTAFNQIIPEQGRAEVEPYKALIDAPGAGATVDFGKEAKAEVRLFTTGEADAKEAATAAKGLDALAQLVLPMAEGELAKQKPKPVTFIKVFKAFGAALKDASIEAKGGTVTMSLALKADLPTISTAVVEGLAAARGVAAGSVGENNLKQIGLALVSYHDSMKALPAAAITDKDGKPLLSWRVAILPQLGQEALYKQFHLDEPWDSEHNKKLVAKMPDVFAAREEDAKGGTTVYRVFHGKGAAFEGDAGTTFASFTDGEANTILVVEAADAVTWTKPDELPFDPKKGPPKLGLKGSDHFLAVFADGALHRLPKKIEKDTLNGLITRNGGEKVAIPPE